MKTNEKKKTVKTRLAFRLLLLVFILLGILAVLIAFTPAILSTDYARTRIMQKINQDKPYQLSINSWSFSWFSGVKMEKIVFKDGKNTTVGIPSAEMTSGLIKLIPAIKDLGEITVTDPHVLVEIPAAAGQRMENGTTEIRNNGNRETEDGGQGTENGKGKTEDGKSLAAEGEGKAEGVKPDQPIVMPFDMTGILKVKNGIIDVTTLSDGQKYIISDIEGEVNIKSVDKPVTFKLSLNQNNMQGRLTASGNVSLFRDRVLKPEEAGAELVMMVDNLTLKPFGLIAAAYADVPEFSGLMNTRLSLRMESAAKIELDGQASISDLIMSGGPIGADRPYFDSIKCDFSLNRSGMNLNISSCQLTAPFGSFKASGTLKDTGDGFPQGSVQCSADMDLTVLASEFHSTLGIKKGLKLTKGRAVSSVIVNSTHDKLKILTDSKITPLEARDAGKTITLDTPFHITSSISKTKNSLEIDDIRLESKFAKGRGKGNLDNMSVSLEADIQQAIREVGKFVELKGYDAAGDLSAMFSMTKSGPSEHCIDVKASIKNLVMAGVTARPLKQSNVDARAALRIQLTDAGKLAGMKGMMFKLSAPALTADITAENAETGSKPDELNVKGASLSLTADLATLCDALRQTRILTNDLALAGALTVDAKMNINKGSIYADSVNAVIRKLEVGTGGTSFADPQVMINASMQASPKANVARIKDMSILMTAGTVKITDVLIKDLKQPGSGLDARASAELDLAKLSRGLKPAKNAPPMPVLKGILKADIASSTTGNEQEIKAVADIAGFSMTSAQGFEVSDPMVKSILNMKIERNSGAARLDTLKLTSGIMSLDASGHYGGKRNMLVDLSGKYEADLGKLAGMINSSSGTAISMEGYAKDSFRIRMPVDGRKPVELLKALEGNAGLQIARLSMYGMDMRGISTKINSAGGVLSADVSTKCNDGDVRIMPRVISSGSALRFELPENSRVLNDVNLTDGMMNEILAKLHPIMKGSAVVSGKIGMSIDHCAAPLDQKLMKKQADFSGSIDIRDAEFRPSGIVGAIYQLCGMDLKVYGIKNGKIDFKCRNGKIETSPMTIIAGGVPVTLSGAVTLDGMVDCTAEIPVTEKMIGERYYKYVKDAKIKLPITGPVDKPGLAKESFKAAIDSLTKEALRIIAENARKAAEEKLQEMLKQQLEKSQSGTNKTEKADIKKDVNDLLDIILKKPQDSNQ